MLESIPSSFIVWYNIRSMKHKLVRFFGGKTDEFKHFSMFEARQMCVVKYKIIVVAHTQLDKNE